MKQAFENLPVEYIGVSTPAFWKRGSTASGLNQAAIASMRQPQVRTLHPPPIRKGLRSECERLPRATRGHSGAL
jgi:hypothetical protein